MDANEKRLWHMVDVGDFGSAGNVFSYNLVWIEEGIEEGQTDFNTEIEACKNTYKLLEDRFTEIDLDKLDARFPEAALRTFKEEALPKFKRNLSALYFLLGRCPDVSTFIVNGAVDACKKFVEHMRIARCAFAGHERYVIYRETNPERKLLFAEKRARYSAAI